MLIRILAVAALIATSAAWAVKPASACTCAMQEPEKWLQDMDAAIVGRVISRAELSGADSGEVYGYIFTIETEKVLKGDIGDRVEVHSSPFGAQCGYGLGAPDGERVGLFMQVNSQGYYESYSCLSIDPDALASLDPVVEQTATSVQRSPTDASDTTAPADSGSNVQLQTETQPQAPEHTNSTARDIAMWSAVSFGGLAAVLFGYAALRMIILRRQNARLDR